MVVRAQSDHERNPERPGTAAPSAGAQLELAPGPPANGAAQKTAAAPGSPLPSQPVRPQIISASRRTDIPAFYMPWFMARIRAGYVRCPHPFTNQIIQTSLRREHVHSVVFWTKDGCTLIKHVDELSDRGYPFVCHYTITAVPRQLEPGVPSERQAVATFEQLARQLGPARVWWRFDPILLSAEHGFEYYRERFAALAGALEGMTERCYFSYADLYGKVKRRLEAAGIAAVDPPAADRRAWAGELAEIAAAHGMRLLACCEDEVVGGKVGKARCIDASLLRTLFPERPVPEAPLRPTRKGCGCSASRDIGMYDTCPNLCVYCYANQNGARVRARYRRHDPAADMLVPAEDMRQDRGHLSGPDQQAPPHNPEAGRSRGDVD